MRSTLFVRRALRAFAHPFEFVLEELLALVFLLLLGRFALRLGEEEIVVVALVASELAARQLDDARGDAIEEIAVVRDEETARRDSARGSPPATRSTRCRDGWSARRG